MDVTHPVKTGSVSCVVYPITCGLCNHCMALNPYNNQSSYCELETLTLLVPQPQIVA